MTRKYFIHDGLKQLGPFSAAELIEKGITRCTPVYTAGMGRYVTAAEIPMLNDLFSGNEACAHTDAVDALNIRKKKDTVLVKNIAWVMLGLVLFMAPFVIYQMMETVPDAALTIPKVAPPVNKPGVQQSATMVEKKEAANPLQYLIAHGKMHKNLVGKKIIKGKISNMASVASYQDMQVAVTFLSNTQTELQTQQFFVNGKVSPNNTISFRNVFVAPAETAGFKLKVLSAAALPE